MGKTAKSIIITVVLAMVATVAVMAGITQYYHVENGTVGTALELEEYLDGELIANETTFAWGTLQVGENLWNYTVRNAGSVNCTVYYIAEELPEGWSETWTANNTLLAPGEYAVGNLTLTVPPTPEGFYEWHSYLTGEEA